MSIIERLVIIPLLIALWSGSGLLVAYLFLYRPEVDEGIARGDSYYVNITKFDRFFCYCGWALGGLIFGGLLYYFFAKVVKHYSRS